MSIQLKEKVPGINQARDIRDRLQKAGVEDVKLFFDKTILPHGMWAVVQIKKQTSQLFIPGSYNEGHLEPVIMWWCKDPYGRFRTPNENDFHDIMVTVKRAQKVWQMGGERLENALQKQEADKDKKHREKQHDRIHAIAPAMKRAIRRELT